MTPPNTLALKKAFAKDIHREYYNGRTLEDWFFKWILKTPILTDKERYKLFKYLSDNDENIFTPKFRSNNPTFLYDPNTNVGDTVYNDDPTLNLGLNPFDNVTAAEAYIDMQRSNLDDDADEGFEDFYENYCENKYDINTHSVGVIPNYEERKANNEDFIFNKNWDTSFMEGETTNKYMDDINKYLSINNTLFELRPTNINHLAYSILEDRFQKRNKKIAPTKSYDRWRQKYVTFADFLYASYILSLNSKTKLYLKLRELGLIKQNPDFEKIMDPDPWGINITNEVLSKKKVGNKPLPENITHNITSILTGAPLSEIYQHDNTSSKKDYKKTGVGGKRIRRYSKKKKNIKHRYSRKKTNYSKK